MKKFLPILVVGILLISGFGAIAININKSNNIIEQQSLSETIEIDVSSLKINDKNNEYFEVSLENQEFYLMNPGQPMIPKIILQILSFRYTLIILPLQRLNKRMKFILQIKKFNR